MTSLRVLAPHFCAGIEFRNDIAIRAAPILAKYVRRETWEAVLRELLRVDITAV